jgi:hypothetical protein
MWSVISEDDKYNGCLDFYFKVRVVGLCLSHIWQCSKVSARTFYVIIVSVFVLGLLSCYEALINNKPSSHGLYYVRQQKCLGKLVPGSSSISLLLVIMVSIWIPFYWVLSLISCHFCLHTWECSFCWILETEGKEEVWNITSRKK